ncbi:uncharacterized protein TNCV_4135311 [Trichonephila clavipes]|nr:uncharacterized protein TNCV_4135311 [Trichonephila clavipes]
MADSQQIETSALHKEEAKDNPPIKPLSAIAHRMFHPPKLERNHVQSLSKNVAAVAEWYWYRNVACFVTGSSPVPLKTRRVGQRCTLNLSRAETSSRWCGS